MANTTLNALNVKITADIKDLKTKVKQAGDVLKTGRKTLNDNAATWAKWGGAVAAANVVAGAAIFKTTSESIKELKNLSFAANTVTEEFQRGAFGAAKFGIETDKYGDILKDVNDKIGDFFAEGAGELVQFFEEIAPKVGITAESFKNLSGQDALGLYVSTLEKSNLSQAEMTTHMERIASDSTLLLPLFKDNAKALKEFSAEAKELGIGLSTIDIEKVLQSQKALAEVGAVISGTLQTATIELAPLVTALANEFTNAAKAAGGMDVAIRDALDGIVDSVGFVLDAGESISRIFEFAGKTVAIFALSVKTNMLAVADFITNRPIQAINELIAAMNSLPWHDIQPIELTELGATIQSEFELAKAAAVIGMDDLANVFLRPLPSVNMKAVVQEAREASDELARIAERDKIAGDAADFITQGESGEGQKLKDETDARLEELTRRAELEQELKAASFQFDADQLAQSLLTQQELADFNNELSEQKHKTHKEAVAEIDRAAAMAQLANAGGILDKLATLSAVGGKKTEKVTRAISITVATIKGIESAVSAYAAGSLIGGPPIGALYAAASIATTGAMIAKMKSGSGSAGRPSGAVPSSGSGGDGNGNNQQAPIQKRVDLTLIGHNFSGEQVRELMGKFMEEMGDGVEFNTTTGI